MTVQMAPLPVTGLEAAQSEKELRVDFRPERFVGAIEIKGYRLVWQRSTMCPCLPTNDQTQQPDPLCPACKGQGWLYFKPSSYVVNAEKIGELDEIQTILANRPDSVVIRGLLTNLANRHEFYDKLGHWSFGTSQVTTRFENKLGYYDRLTNLDSVIAYTEVVEVGKNRQADIIPRYLIVEANLIRSIDTEFTETHLDIVGGKIVWKPNQAPKTGTRITLHYNCHPVWMVVEHPHAIRSTFVNRKLKNPSTPVGEFTELPIQAIVKYEFLP